MHPTNVLATLMRKGLLNSAALVAATHRGFGKVADGTSTRIVTCMINRWKAKIDWKEVYNVRDLPRMGDRRNRAGGEKKEKNGVSLHGLENHCNLILKVEEE